MTRTLPLLNRLLAAVRIVGVDIGARGGFTSDLASIAAGVEAVGLEPDQQECERLNAAATTNAAGFRSLRYVPTAVGGAPAERMLNVYRARGCTSLLTADVAFAKQFAREDYFILDGQVSVKVEPLDQAAARFGFADAHFMKIDIQGAELEAMQSGPKLVGDSLLAIRTEVEFAPIYVNQPLFADVDAELRAKGFMLARFPQLHAWRRGTRVRGDLRAPGPTPLSEAQLVHGDALYFRRPETMNDGNDEDKDRFVRLALLAFAYGHVDLSAAILTERGVAERVMSIAGVAADGLVAELGAWHARRRRRQVLSEAGRRWRDLFR